MTQECTLLSEQLYKLLRSMRGRPAWNREKRAGFGAIENFEEERGEEKKEKGKPSI